MFNGIGKQAADRLNAVKYTPLNGTEKPVFVAEAYAAEQKAHSTASVKGLNEGDWYMPSIDEQYGIFSSMASNGSDPINACFALATGSYKTLVISRWICGRYNRNSSYLSAIGGYFFGQGFVYNGVACCVASYDVGG